MGNCFHFVKCPTTEPPMAGRLADTVAKTLICYGCIVAERTPNVDTEIKSIDFQWEASRF